MLLILYWISYRNWSVGVQLWLILLAIRRLSTSKPFTLALFYLLLNWYPPHFLHFLSYHKLGEDGIYGHQSDLLEVRTLYKANITLTNSIISAFIGFEVRSKLIHISVTIFLRNYCFLIENNCLMPLYG